MLVHVLNRSSSHRRNPNIKRTGAMIDGDNTTHFHLPDDRKKELSEEFHSWKNKGNYLCSERRMEVFLSMMSSGGYYRQVGHIFGLAKSTVFEHTHEVVNFLQDIAEDWISLPVHDELDLLSTAFVNDSEVKNVVLYVDGCIIRITRPAHANDSYYCGRAGKNCDSINAQFIVDKFGNVRHVVTGFSGECSIHTVCILSVVLCEFVFSRRISYAAYACNIISKFLLRDNLSYNISLYIPSTTCSTQ